MQQLNHIHLLHWYRCTWSWDNMHSIGQSTIPMSFCEILGGITTPLVLDASLFVFPDHQQSETALQ
jgi:hypothetical protein